MREYSRRTLDHCGVTGAGILVSWPLALFFLYLLAAMKQEAPFIPKLLPGCAAHPKTHSSKTNGSRAGWDV